MVSHRKNIKDIRRKFKTPTGGSVSKTTRAKVVNDGSIYDCRDTGKKYTGCKKVADVINSSEYSEDGYGFWNFWLFFILIIFIIVIFIPY